MENSRSVYSAASSALGYLFQCRYALLESLRRLRQEDDFQVWVETLDDVVFDNADSALDILQTKHHVNRSANLADASPDLWSTLRIWAEGMISGEIPVQATFFLVTTANAPSGSAAYYLRPDQSRDMGKALERLTATAESSTNAANRPGYAAFRALSSAQKRTLLESIRMIDSAPLIAELDEELRRELVFAVRREFLDSLVERVEGWWFRRVVRQLAEPKPLAILGEEIYAQIAQLSEQFREDNLPIDDDIVLATVDSSGYQDNMFVHQLRLIGVGNPRILHAIRNYFRAFEQRSRWIRENLIMVGDLSRYEQLLVEEWELQFEQMRDDLGTAAAEEEMKQAAQKLYKWVESGSHPVIRPHCVEPFVARGSYQILADCERVGWHPEFAERLQQLLESTIAGVASS